jgi:predicted amidohydrolase YtcJ
MRTRLLLALVATLTTIIAAGCGRGTAPSTTGTGASTVPSAQAADAIYTNGDIVTVNDTQPTAEALAVKDGKIVAVGARADLEQAHKGAATKVVDLGGKTLIPAFIDAHSHYFSSLTVANQANVYAPPAGPGKDVESIVAALKQFAEEKETPRAS